MRFSILQVRILEWVACPPLGDLPDPGIEPVSLMSLALAGGFFTTSTTPGSLLVYVETCAIVVYILGISEVRDF